MQSGLSEEMFEPGAVANPYNGMKEVMDGLRDKGLAGLSPSMRRCGFVHGNAIARCCCMLKM